MILRKIPPREESRTFEVPTNRSWDTWRSSASSVQHNSPILALHLYHLSRPCSSFFFFLRLPLLQAEQRKASPAHCLEGSLSLRFSCFLACKSLLDTSSEVYLQSDLRVLEAVSGSLAPVTLWTTHPPTPPPSSNVEMVAARHCLPAIKLEASKEGQKPWRITLEWTLLGHWPESKLGFPWSFKLSLAHLGPTRSGLSPTIGPPSLLPRPFQIHSGPSCCCWDSAFWGWHVYFETIVRLDLM